jgi:hypothetical protein
MEAIRSSETSVLKRATQHNILEDGIVQDSRCLGLSRKYVRRSLHDDGFYPFHLTMRANSTPSAQWHESEMLSLITNQSPMAYTNILQWWSYCHLGRSQEHTHLASTVSRQPTHYCGNAFSASFLYQCEVRYNRWHVGWSHYFRRSYNRT